MTSRLMTEKRFLDEHPGVPFDESWHESGVPALPAGRGKILRLEQALAKMPQFECPLKHYFADGLYVREIFIPAGVALVGYIHMRECITTVSQGEIAIFDGDKTIVIRAPFTLAVPPGSKKAGYALTDTVWSDAYANADNERDIAKLEARLTADTHADYLARTRLRLEPK